MKKLIYQTNADKKGPNLLSELSINSSTFKLMVEGKYIEKIGRLGTDTLEFKNGGGNNDNRYFWQPQLTTNINNAENFALIVYNDRHYIYRVTTSTVKVGYEIRNYLDKTYLHIFDMNVSVFGGRSESIANGVFSISNEGDGFQPYIYAYRNQIFDLFGALSLSFNNGSVQDHLNDQLFLKYNYDESIIHGTNPVQVDGYALRNSIGNISVKPVPTNVRPWYKYQQTGNADWTFVVHKFNTKFSLQFFDHVKDEQMNNIRSVSELSNECKGERYFKACSTLEQPVFDKELLFNKCLTTESKDCELLDEEDYCNLPQYENRFECSTHNFCKTNDNYLKLDRCIRKDQSKSYRKLNCRNHQPYFKDGRIRVKGLEGQTMSIVKRDGTIEQDAIDVEDQVVKSCVMYWNEDPSFDEVKKQSFKHQYGQVNVEDINAYTSQAAASTAKDFCEVVQPIDESGKPITLEDCTKLRQKYIVNNLEQFPKVQQLATTKAEERSNNIYTHLVNQKLNDLCLIPEYARSNYKQHSCSSNVCISDATIDVSGAVKTDIKGINIRQSC